MALNYYQFQFGTFAFGNGTPYVILDVDGLKGLPDIRVQDSSRGYNDGDFSGRDFYGGRTITFTMNVLAGNGNSAQTNFNLLAAALNPQQTGTTPLYFQMSASESQQVINARVRSRKAMVDPEYTFGFIRAQVTMFAPNPKYYDATGSTGTLQPQTPTGRTYNRTYNLTYPSSTAINSLTITNNGWATTYPQITLVGPITNPTLSLVSSNGVAQTAYLSINYTLGATDSLVIDLENRLITLNGSSARNLLTGSSQWFGVPSGSSIIGLTGTGFTAGVTQATVFSQSAYV